MRVFTTGSTMPGQQTWLDDERAYPVWKRAGELKLPVAMQMTAEGIPLLLKIVKAFPGTNFALDHCARPVLSDGPPYAAAQSMWDLASYKNVYLKITSRTVEHMQGGKATPETFMGKLVATFGSDHLLWGSNWPAHDDTLPNIVKETLHVLASVSDADRANILSGTALQLYPSLK
jgi:predicted TIM-barrel fold metal-dependent hydrolase